MYNVKYKPTERVEVWEYYYVTLLPLPFVGKSALILTFVNYQIWRFSYVVERDWIDEHPPSVALPPHLSYPKKLSDYSDYFKSSCYNGG